MITNHLNIYNKKNKNGTEKISYNDKVELIKSILKAQIYNNIIEKKYDKRTNQQSCLEKIDLLIENNILIGDNVNFINEIKQYISDIYKPKNISNIIETTIDKHNLDINRINKWIQYLI